MKLQTLELFDKKIITELGDKINIYHKVVLVMTYSTQEYYNMRRILGLECKQLLNFVSNYNFTPNRKP